MQKCDNMEKELQPSIGTELKINVNAELGGGQHLGGVHFECEFYAGKNTDKCVVLTKEDMVRIDDDNYVGIVDTRRIGVGEYWCKLIVHVPDRNCTDGIRDEVVRVNTGVKVVE